MRVRKLKQWDKNHKYCAPLTNLLTKQDATYQNYQKGIENPDPEVSTNVMIGLINLISYLLSRQIQKLEKEFLNEGSLRERMSQARIDIRKNRNK